MSSFQVLVLVNKEFYRPNRLSCDVQINEKDKIIQLCPLIKKGCVLKFDLAKYFGKENEIKQIFSTIPQQTAINKKIFSQGGKYSLKVERKYI